jgi:hypothetical protein
MGDVLFVRSVERITDLDTVSNGLGNGQGPLKGNPFDEFHDRVIRTNVVECADIGMIQRRNRLRLMLEAFGELRRRNLDRDVAPQARVMRPVDFVHPAGTDERQDFVGATFVAHRKRHGWLAAVSRSKLLLRQRSCSCFAMRASGFAP